VVVVVDVVVVVGVVAAGVVAAGVVAAGVVVVVVVVAVVEVDGGDVEVVVGGAVTVGGTEYIICAKAELLTATEKKAITVPVNNLTLNIR
jgi:hypothetical protein